MENKSADAGSFNDFDVVTVSEGLIRLLNSDSQIAFLLSHELAHSSRAHEIRYQYFKEGSRSFFETEADAVGVKILVAGGYPAYAAVDAIHTMERANFPKGPLSEFNTHAVWQLRAERLEKQITSNDLF